MAVFACFATRQWRRWLTSFSNAASPREIGPWLELAWASPYRLLRLGDQSPDQTLVDCHVNPLHPKKLCNGLMLTS